VLCWILIVRMEQRRIFGVVVTLGCITDLTACGQVTPGDDQIGAGRFWQDVLYVRIGNIRNIALAIRALVVGFFA
jgi:hypothetical protein